MRQVNRQAIRKALPRAERPHKEVFSSARYSPAFIWSSAIYSYPLAAAQINSKAFGYMERYSMSGHFADIKSACVLGIMTALRNYKKEKARLSHTPGNTLKERGWFSIVFMPEFESATLDGTCEKCCYGCADGEELRSNFSLPWPLDSAL